jgi:hypothetical protein
MNNREKEEPVPLLSVGRRGKENLVCLNIHFLNNNFRQLKQIKNRGIITGNCEWKRGGGR